MTTATINRTRKRAEIETIRLKHNTVALGRPGKGVVIDEDLLRRVQTIARFHRN